MNERRNYPPEPPSRRALVLITIVLVSVVAANLIWKTIEIFGGQGH